MKHIGASFETITELTCPAELAETAPGGKVRCLACAHGCSIAEGRQGVCAVRGVREGVLRVPRGYVSSVACVASGARDCRLHAPRLDS